MHRGKNRPTFLSSVGGAILEASATASSANCSRYARSRSDSDVHGSFRCSWPDAPRLNESANVKGPGFPETGFAVRGARRQGESSAGKPLIAPGSYLHPGSTSLIYDRRIRGPSVRIFAAFIARAAGKADLFIRERGIAYRKKGEAVSIRWISTGGGWRASCRVMHDVTAPGYTRITKKLIASQFLLFAQLVAQLQLDYNWSSTSTVTRDHACGVQRGHWRSLDSATEGVPSVVLH